MRSYNLNLVTNFHTIKVQDTSKNFDLYTLNEKVKAFVNRTVPYITWKTDYLSKKDLFSSISKTTWFFQELNDIRQSGLKSFRDIQVDESNILTWQGLIVPVSTYMT